MAYTAPYIDDSGLHIPSYGDILSSLLEDFKSIYGQDVYLGTDSADYQWISSVALKIFDTLQALQLVYNNRNPQTATGAGLDGILKINNIKRKAASYSTCVVTITGDAGTVITGGVVSDIRGNKWNLPPVVTIGGGGTIDVTATCQVIGAISALATNINSISTPQAGWTGVNNAGAASLGQPVETDPQVKQRRDASVAQPSQTMLDGTIDAIAALAGVTRSKVYENPTAGTVAGLPPNSITAVVEGGALADIAQAIYLNRGIGCATNGNTTVNVTDPITQQMMGIKFSVIAYTPIYVALNVHALTGYTTAVRDAIKQAIADYLNSLDIGEEVAISAISAAAMSATDIKRPTFSIPSGGVAIDVAPAPTATADITIAYDHVASGDVVNVAITLV